MKCYAKSSENLIVQLANLPPKPPFLSKSFHLFSCTGKTHYLCISSAKNKEQNKTFLPFNFQNIGRQLVQYAASGNNITTWLSISYINSKAIILVENHLNRGKMGCFRSHIFSCLLIITVFLSPSCPPVRLRGTKLCPPMYFWDFLYKIRQNHKYLMSE